MILNIQYHLFAVLRDIVFVNALKNAIRPLEETSLEALTTNTVFSILRNAKAIEMNTDPNLVVCWEGIRLMKPNTNIAVPSGKSLACVS